MALKKELMKPKIVAIAGKSNSGKTTLIEKLISCLRSRGHRIESATHAHHGLKMDRKGKDSWRHRKAGASATLVIAEGEIALLKDNERTCAEKITAYLSDMDVILAEGFKGQDLPKIEIFRREGPHLKPLGMLDENGSPL